MPGRKLYYKDVLAFIKDFISVSQRPPSYREIARNFKVSPSTAHRYVKWLSDDDLVCLRTGARGIVVI